MFAPLIPDCGQLLATIALHISMDCSVAYALGACLTTLSKCARHDLHITYTLTTFYALFRLIPKEQRSADTRIG